MQVWEDIAYNHGSLILPDLFRNRNVGFFSIRWHRIVNCIILPLGVVAIIGLFCISFVIHRHVTEGM